MNKRDFRCLTPSFFVLGLLVISGAAAADASPHRAAQAREALKAFGLPQSIACEECALAFQECFAGCFADARKGRTGTCLTACDKAAATCTCGEVGALRSEDLVKRWGETMDEEASCHGWISCQPTYSSCASWSNWSSCGEVECLMGPFCVECTEESCPNEAPYVSAPVERFRVCFDQFSNPCTEWQIVNYPSCGCEP